MSNTIIMYENGKAVGGEGHPTDADDITFDNTGTDIVANKAGSAIKEVNAKFDKGSVSVTANGVKTYAQLLKDLFDLLDTSKITKDTMFAINNTGYYSMRSYDGGTITFAAVNASATSLSADRIFLNTSVANCHFYAVSVSGSPAAVSAQTLDANVPPNGSLAIYY